MSDYVPRSRDFARTMARRLVPGRGQAPGRSPPGPRCSPGCRRLGRRLIALGSGDLGLHESIEVRTYPALHAGPALGCRCPGRSRQRRGSPAARASAPRPFSIRRGGAGRLGLLSASSSTSSREPPPATTPLGTSGPTSRRQPLDSRMRRTQGRSSSRLSSVSCPGVAEPTSGHPSRYSRRSTCRCPRHAVAVTGLGPPAAGSGTGWCPSPRSATSSRPLCRRRRGPPRPRPAPRAPAAVRPPPARPAAPSPPGIPPRGPSRK